MKLHKLTLKNINSLLGTWQIDFDDETYRQNGIFGIVGNTGAGKTTLLDAICLAIYRETPRLGKITKNQNALISTDTTECQAQVELSLTRNNQTQRYIFLFSQARATRGKSKGELQEPTHEILLQNNRGEFKPISEKKSETDKLAIELLGMNFTQFTRSVLLAQGGFSAFLQANSEERGQILEKITGTEIYASIGKKTYEKHKTQKQQIDDKKAKLNDIAILSDDELFALKTELDNTTAIKLSLDKTLTQLDNKLKQKNQYTQLQNALASYQLESNTLYNELMSFQSSLTKLNHAKQHNDLLPIFDHLSSLKNKQTELSEQKIQLTTQLKNETIALEITQNNLSHADKIFNQHNAIHQEWQPKLLALKQLDNELGTLTTTHKFNTQTLVGQQNTNAELTQKINETNNAITTLKQAYHDNQQFLTDYHKIGAIHTDTLSTKLVDFIYQLEKLLNKINELKQKQHKITKLREQKNQITPSLKTHYPNGKITTIPTYLNTLDNELINARTQLNAVEIFITQFCELCAKKDLQQQKQEHLKITQTQLKDNELEIKTQATTLQHLKNTYEFLEKTHRLSDEIYRLTEFIDTLQDGTPCPLCGSTQHPYAKNPPKLHDDLINQQHNLAQKKSELTDFESQYKTTELQLMALQATIQHQEQQLTELDTDIDTLQKKLSNDWQNLLVYLNTEVDFEQLNHELLLQLKNEFIELNKEKKDTYTTIKNLFESYDTYDKKILELYQEWQQDKDKLSPLFEPIKTTQMQLSQVIHSHYDLVYQLLNTHKPTNKQSVDWVFDTINQLNKLYQQGLNKDNLSHFYQMSDELENNMAYFKDSANLIKHDFLTAVNDYHKKSNDLEQTSNHLAYHQSNYQTLQTELQNNEKELHELKTTLAQLNHQIQTLSTKKSQDFGAIIADDKEKELATQLQLAKDDLTANKEQLALITQKIQDLNQRLTDNQRQLDLNDKELTDIEHKFQQKLLQSFKNLDEFLTAKLPDDELLALESHYQTLIENQKQIDLYLSQTNTQIQCLLNDNPAIESWVVDELESQFWQTKTNLETLLTDFGTKQEKYTQAMDNQQKKLQLLNDIEQLEYDFLPLQQLNELIGSSDGKKYRNFAQSLTLTALLNEANNELGKLSKRYLLTASNDDKNPLGIDVIDTYQGNTVRQSKNLSGGESFVVSLALALGLSNMSSQKMQIDSLFLDEGFGTLDEEALDMALNALSEIQSDGKMIGIISHIGALKERLYTKIMVEKKSGGVSVLVGAGVTRLNEIP